MSHLEIQYSSVSEGLFRNIIVFFLTFVDDLNNICVLPSTEWLLSFLIGNEGFCFIDIIDFTIGKSQMISLISSSPNWHKNIGNHKIEQLRHIKEIEKLCSVSDIEPHPISVGLQSDRLQSQDFQEV